jgi:hypothetical protein
MGMFTNLRRAAARSELMHAMFGRLGIGDWFAGNPARAAVLRGAAIRCATCGHERECAQWLDNNPVADHAPDFCRNRELADRIRSATA